MVEKTWSETGRGWKVKAFKEWIIALSILGFSILATNILYDRLFDRLEKAIEKGVRKAGESRPSCQEKEKEFGK